MLGTCKPRLGPWPSSRTARLGCSVPLPSSSRTFVPRPCSSREATCSSVAVVGRHTADRERAPRTRTRATPPGDFDLEPSNEEQAEEKPAGLGPRDDDVLPADLADAVSSAAQATADALQRGNTRCEVELLMPEFWDPISGPIFPNRGDQDRFWLITRRFVEELSDLMNTEAKAVYPDSGVAAMLANQWPDRNFQIGSLNDRRPVTAADALVVIACADPPGADDCIKLVRTLAAQDETAGVMERPVVLFNQRLASGDVGLGLNARRMRGNFLKAFTITYSLRPIGDSGTVFKRYPGMWQVFLDDPTCPGRYRRVAEQSSRPQGEALDALVDQILAADGGAVPGATGADGKPVPPPSVGLMDQLATTIKGMQRFMKSLST